MKITRQKESFVSQNNDYIRRQKWNRDAGYYLEDGSYKPKINVRTGAYIIPKEIYDMWD